MKDQTDAQADGRHNHPTPSADTADVRPRIADTTTVPHDMAGTTPTPPARFIGTGPAMSALYDLIERAAISRASVFITGASGTGKDICAQTIHDFSPRAHRPFIALNCAAIPAGLWESELFGHVKGAFTGATTTREGAIARASGGTLFLDEICDMPIDMQSKLLRFLQNHHYMKIGGTREEKADVRIVCASNKDPAHEIDRGAFREDLYYRLHVIPICMPPLAGRGGDILDLADYFLHLYAAEEGKVFTAFSRETEAFLLHHAWPGNVRELQNMIRHLVVVHTGPLVDLAMLRSAPVPRRASDLPAGPTDRGAPSKLAPLWQIEKTAIETAISLCGGNIPQAAAMLEIAPSTIYRKIQSWEDRH